MVNNKKTKCDLFNLDGNLVQENITISIQSIPISEIQPEIKATLTLDGFEPEVNGKYFYLKIGKFYGEVGLLVDTSEIPFNYTRCEVKFGSSFARSDEFVVYVRSLFL